MWYIHIMEYYSTLKRNKTVTQATAWLVIIMLSNMSDTKGQIAYDCV